MAIKNKYKMICITPLERQQFREYDLKNLINRRSIIMG